MLAVWKVKSALNLEMAWLDVIYYLSSVKLVITLLKYLPQALLNYRRKSTHGWAITASLLDLTGGVFSLAQMFLLAWNHGMCFVWLLVLLDYSINNWDTV